MLEFKPQRFEKLKERLPAALQRVWNVREMNRAGLPDDLSVDRAGLHPENIFDFMSGLRLIVSIDLDDEEDPHYTGLHVSASYFYEGLSQDLRAKSVEDFLRLLTTTLKALGIDPFRTRFTGFTDNAVYHMIFEEDYSRQFITSLGGKM